jgi:drug/metabolite transporter (DMT)-like permease
MGASLLTVVLFSFSALSASQASRRMGPVNANLFRLIIATLLLGAYAHLWGQGNAGPGRSLFFWSGLVGFGLGDMAMFHAYERIGSRRAILLSQSLAAPFAALTEWLWMGTRIGLTQGLFALLILVGVACALMPHKRNPLPRAQRIVGSLFGVFAALGQAWGAVISRRALALNRAAGIELDGLSAAWQRIGAGLLVGALFYLWFRLHKRRWSESAWVRLPRSERPFAYFLSVLNAVCGPVLGVGCYQWALSTSPSALVLAVVATTPLFMIPFTWWIEGDRPGRLALLGSVMAVAGVAGLVI